MVTYLMHQNMGDDGAQRLVMGCPIIEDGSAVELDHIGKLARLHHGLALGQTAPAKQSQ